ncbi:MAG: superoxide dismutase, Ni [Pseudomonadota bacterium]
MFKAQLAHAHCDVPCGIYDPIAAQNAALSVVRFMNLIAEYDGATLSLADQAKLSRLVSNKETHAADVKSEVVIIWGDYFKAPQFEAHPNLHELTHEILMTASKCKQGIDPADGRRLVELVNEFAATFWETKGVSTQTVVVPYEPKLPLVQPIFEQA